MSSSGTYPQPIPLISEGVPQGGLQQGSNLGKTEIFKSNIVSAEIRLEAH
jgi:hypothetical protein